MTSWRSWTWRRQLQWRLSISWLEVQSKGQPRHVQRRTAAARLTCRRLRRATASRSRTAAAKLACNRLRRATAPSRQRTWRA
jgi:hypothetical protein